MDTTISQAQPDLSFTIIIPARLKSIRLPNKALLEIGGLPMVVRVAQEAKQAGASQVIVATDNSAIMEACSRYQINAVMTAESHENGTSRLGEVIEYLSLPDEAIVVNVQGDEPFIDPKLIYSVAQTLQQSHSCAIATAAHPIYDVDEIRNPNIVKVVIDQQQQATYFSRAPIPWPRDGFELDNHFASAQSAQQSSSNKNHPYLRHIGLYAYRAQFLRQYSRLAMAPTEKLEALEQLRALWHGEKIAVWITHTAPASGIDTQEDYLSACAKFHAASSQA